MWSGLLNRLGLRNILSVARPVETQADRHWFEVSPDSMYPAALAELQTALAEPAPTDARRIAWLMAAQVNVPDAWRYAYRPLTECPAEWRAARGQLLEAARLWFTEKLHQSIGGEPMGLRILKSERWRL